MADEMYDESEPTTAESDELPTERDAKDDNKSDDTEDQLALVPNSFFKDKPKPGMREMVKVVEVYEGECSIKCVYGDKDDDREDDSDDGDDDDSMSESEDEAYD